MKNNISSKEAYFKRPNNTMTLEAWENYKKDNPKSEYIGETCWVIHDSMIARGKPAVDSMVIIKALLSELNIEFVLDVDHLEITSDLSGQTIIVLDIESDDLLFQLEKAGATVVYITSNANYSNLIPDRYFNMYPENYDSTDFPATDKRTLFSGKNIIAKYINFYEYKNNLFSTRLYNIIKEISSMQISKVLMNPPYDGNLHLKVLETTLKAVRFNNPQCEIVSVQPARWLEDPLAEYKQGSDYKKYKNTIVNKISSVQLVSIMDASLKFNIGAPCDLGIYTFNNTKNFSGLYSELALSIVKKVTTKKFKSLFDVQEKEALDGWRVELKNQIQEGNHNAGSAESSKKAPVKVCLGPYFNGYDTNNVFWSLGRSKNQHTRPEGSAFPLSTQFTTELEATNFVKSCQTEFYKNLIHLLKCDINIPLRFLPYMEDYSKVWTDEDYCEFFGLNEEEAEFMCRTVDDYRVKDFINYISLEE